MIVKSFLFARVSALGGFNVFVQVDAFTKDLAVARLREKYPHIPAMDWDYLDEVSPDDSLGRIGEHLKLPQFAKSVH